METILKTEIKKHLLLLTPDKFQEISYTFE